MVVACMIKDLEDWLWTGKIRRPRYFKHRGGKMKNILQAEGGKI
jgi:hypothetical protein